jgi:hypothetical protein
MRPFEPHPGFWYTVSQSSWSEADGREYTITTSGVVHQCQVWVEINETIEGAQVERDTRRTVDATPTAETLPGLHGCGAAAKCRARLGNVRTNGARARCKVAQESQGLRVCWVVVRRGTCLE